MSQRAIGRVRAAYRAWERRMLGRATVRAWQRERPWRVLTEAEIDAIVAQASKHPATKRQRVYRPSDVLEHTAPEHRPSYAVDDRWIAAPGLWRRA